MQQLLKLNRFLTKWKEHHNTMTNFIDNFYYYLQHQEQSLDDAFELVCQDCEEAGLSEDEITDVVGTLITEVTRMFAKHYSEYEPLYESNAVDFDTIFNNFCKANELSEDFANALAITINKNTSSDDNSSDDVDSSEVVLTADDWKNLSPSQIQDKRLAYLAALAAYGKDARLQRPFLKQKSLKIGDMETPYRAPGAASRVSQFDRPSHRFGFNYNLGEVAKPFIPKKDLSDPRNHPLHDVAVSHGYKFSHSANNHHIWHKGSHVVTAPFNNTQWNTQTNIYSAHQTQGIGSLSLSKHLTLKNRKWKNDESYEGTAALPHTQLLENLLSPQAINKVQRTADYINKNESKVFGVLSTHTAGETPTEQFKAGAKLRVGKTF